MEHQSERRKGTWKVGRRTDIEGGEERKDDEEEGEDDAVHCYVCCCGSKGQQ
jgi:hypothetical protein